MDLVEEGSALLVVSERGYAKRAPLNTYPAQSRYGKGVATFAKTSAQTGRLAAACVVGEDDDVTITSVSGAMLNIKAGKIALQNRSTRGIVAMQLKETDRVAGVVRLAAKPRRPGVKAAEPAKRGTRSKGPEKPTPHAKKAVKVKQASKGAAIRKTRRS